MTENRRRARQSRREATRQAQAGSVRSRWILVAVIVVIAGVGALAIVLGGSSTGGSSPAISASPGSGSPGTSGTGGAVPVITGSPLPVFTATSGDPAKGMTAPAVTGTSFSGSPVAIQPTGRPTVVIFIAHWCPHCQREVTLLQAWINQNGAPEGVDLVSVATGNDPSRPNYPPDAWLEREGWTIPVMVDPTNSVATAFGLSAYPYWVFLDGEGKVVMRTTGELTINDLQAILTGLEAP
jgi:cytochrome c biogenesis protein CcmG/thiol:disulfide interchange protein DsbE